MDERVQIGLYTKVDEKIGWPITDYDSSVIPRVGEKIKLGVAMGTPYGVPSLRQYEADLLLRVTEVVHQVVNQLPYAEDTYHTGELDYVTVWVVADDAQSEEKLKALIEQEEQGNE